MVHSVGTSLPRSAIHRTNFSVYFVRYKILNIRRIRVHWSAGGKRGVGMCIRGKGESESGYSVCLRWITRCVNPQKSLSGSGILIEGDPVYSHRENNCDGEGGKAFQLVTVGISDPATMVDYPYNCPRGNFCSARRKQEYRPVVIDGCSGRLRGSTSR